MPELEGYLTAKEAEQHFDVSRSWLMRQHKLGRIAARKIGPIWLFETASIQAWKDNPTYHQHGGDRKSKKYRQSEPDPGPDTPMLALGASV